MTNKNLPISHDAECALLGAIIFRNDIYNQISNIVIPDDFDLIPNKELFEKISKLLSNSKPVDAVILSETGDMHAFQLLRCPFVTENALEYANIVRRTALLRRLIIATSKFNSLSHNINATPEHLIHELSAELITLRNRVFSNNESWLQGVSILLEQPSSPKWLIKDWLPQEALTMIHAKPGVGKSFVALDWGLHISTGLPSWFDCRVNSGPVVYLAGEGHHGLRRRIKAWSQYYNKQPFNMVVSSSPRHLDTPEGLLFTLESIRQLKERPVLIIIDTLHQFSSGHINDWQDATRITDACNKLRIEFNATVLLIHHVGHSDLAANRAMGSQALNAPLDVNINLKRDDSGALVMQQVKMKDHDTANKLLLELKNVEISDWIDEEGNKMQSAVVALACEQKELNYLGAKMKNAQKLFEEIWLWAGHKLTIDAKPYIMCTEIEEYATNVRKMNPRSSRHVASFNAKNAPFAYLLITNMVEMHGEGCAICDQEWLNKVLNTPV